MDVGGDDEHDGRGGRLVFLLGQITLQARLFLVCPSISTRLLMALVSSFAMSPLERALTCPVPTRPGTGVPYSYVLPRAATGDSGIVRFFACQHKRVARSTIVEMPVIPEEPVAFKEPSVPDADGYGGGSITNSASVPADGLAFGEDADTCTTSDDWSDDEWDEWDGPDGDDGDDDGGRYGEFQCDRSLYDGGALETEAAFESVYKDESFLYGKRCSPMCTCVSLWPWCVYGGQLAYEYCDVGASPVVLWPDGAPSHRARSVFMSRRDD